MVPLFAEFLLGHGNLLGWVDVQLLPLTDCYLGSLVKLLGRVRAVGVHSHSGLPLVD